MSSVTRAFLRYLPRRRSLSVLQLLGIACGVAAVIGNAPFSPFSALELHEGNRIPLRKGNTRH